jgi:hypothetical protein
MLLREARRHSAVATALHFCEMAVAGKVSVQDRRYDSHKGLGKKSIAKKSSND